MEGPFVEGEQSAAPVAALVELPSPRVGDGSPHGRRSAGDRVKIADEAQGSDAVIESDAGKDAAGRQGVAVLPAALAGAEVEDAITMSDAEAGVGWSAGHVTAPPGQP
jgi:hypothetical protein